MAPIFNGLTGFRKRWQVADNPPEHNIEVVYKWYILPIGGLYHLLWEPKTTIDMFW